MPYSKFLREISNSSYAWRNCLIDSFPQWQVDMNDNLLGLASYIVRWANLFFRIIRSEGIWIEGSACAAAKSARMEMNYTWIKHYQTLYIISYVSWMYRFFLWIPWLKPSLWDLLCWTVLNQGGFCSFSRCFHAGYNLFKYRPKYHLGMHMCLNMDWNLSLNPCCSWSILIIYLILLPHAFNFCQL